MRIEQVGPDEWERVRAVRLRALHEAPDAFWVTHDEERVKEPSAWRARLARPDAATFLASEDDRDVGLAVGAPHHEHEAEAGVYAVWVAPPWRGRGIAVALVAAVVDWARAAGYRRLRLEVGDTNTAAVRVYERLGFEPTGATSRFPPPREQVTEHERLLEL